MKIKTKRVLLKRLLAHNSKWFILFASFFTSFLVRGQSEYKLGFYVSAMPSAISRPPKPLAWTSHNKVSQALHFSYERIRQYSYGSVSWGGSVGGFQLLKESQYALSTYVSFRVHPVHIGRFFVPFIEYSAGGPTYVTEKVVGDENLGSHFLFQNFLGIGIIIKSFTVGFILPHYSSGDLFKPNPGFDVPLLMYLGYRIF